MVFVSLFGPDYDFASATAAAVVSAFDDTIWAWHELKQAKEE